MSHLGERTLSQLVPWTGLGNLPVGCSQHKSSYTLVLSGSLVSVKTVVMWFHDGPSGLMRANEQVTHKRPWVFRRETLVPDRYFPCLV